MKYVKLTAVLSAVLLLTACSDYGEKRIVKVVTADKETISFYYYDFTQDKPSFAVEQKENTGIENTMTNILSENDYNLKLCNFVVCDRSVIDDNMDELAAALLNSRFSPDVCIVEGNTDEYKKYTDKPKSNYPLYSYTVTDGVVNGVVENTDSGEKHIVYENKIVNTLDRRKSFTVDAIGNIIEKGVYTFENSDRILTANFENINTFYSAADGQVNITLSAVLKNYKGMPANKTSKNQFINLLEYNLEKDIREIHDDRILVESLGLDWYAQLYKADKIKINIEIK